jgi:hypothetical protein
VSKPTPSQNISYNFCPSRILMPNTPYRVLSVDSTILSGGLFYSLPNITESCIGVLQTFLAPSNSHQPKIFRTSRLLLSRMLIYIHQQFVMTPITDAGHLPNLETMEGLLAVLSLVNIAELGNVLHPDTYHAGVNPEERRFLIHVRKQGRHLLRWMNGQYRLVPALGSSSMAMISQLANQYLLHQADALQVSKMSMDGAGLRSSIPGLTHSALCLQIFGCIGNKHQELPGCAKTFTWDQGTYQISRGRAELYRVGLSGETPDDESWIKAGRLLYKPKK